MMVCDKVRSAIDSVLQKYLAFLYKFPYVVLFVSGTVSIALSLIGIFISKPFALRDLGEGYETRNTDISGSISAWRSIIAQTQQTPTDGFPYYRKWESSDNQIQPAKKRKRRDAEEPDNFLQDLIKGFNPLCIQLDYPIYDDYIVQFTVSAKNLNELLSAEFIKKLCTVEEGIFKILKNYKGIAYTNQTWSVASYALCLSDKQICSKLTDTDLIEFRQSVWTCLPYRDLLYSCYKANNRQSCNQLPFVCQNTLYSQLFYYILSNDLSNNNTEVFAKVFLPAQLYYVKLRYDKSVSFDPYKRLYQYIANEKSIAIRGLDIGQKNFQLIAIFSSELSYLYISIGLVALLLLSFSTSVFFFICATINLLLTMGVSYFWYRLVIGVDYFPFSNFPVYLILIAVWIEDPLVLISLWRNSKFLKTVEPPTVEHRLNKTLKLFWRITTTKTMASAAVLAVCIISDIITIKCACLFGVLLTVVSMFLSLTWLTSVMVIQARWINPLRKRICIRPIAKQLRSLQFYSKTISDWINENVIERFALLWIVLFCSLSIAGGIVTFAIPKMRPPSINPTQTLDKNHLLEWQDSYSDKLFENMKHRRAIGYRLVWGIVGVRSYAFHKAKTLAHTSDSGFTVTNDTISCLADFCHQLQGSQLNRHPTVFGSVPLQCWAKNFTDWSEKRDCKGPGVCCNRSHKNFNSSNINICLTIATKALWHPENGPIFNSSVERTMVAFSQTFDTIFNFTLNYDKLRTAHQTTNEVLKNISLTTQCPMPNLIFTFDPELSSWYDMQISLIARTKEGLGIAILLAFFGLLLGLRCILTAMLTLTTVVGSVVITYAILTLIGWNLNITEVILLIIIASLTTTNITVNSVINRRSKSSGKRFSIGFLPVSFVSIVAGAVLIGRSVLILHQIGVSLVVYSCISGFSSTVVFYSLLHCRRWCGSKNPTEHRDKLMAVFHMKRISSTE